MKFRRELMLKLSIEDGSRDVKEIMYMQDLALKLHQMASRYQDKRFDIADEAEGEGVYLIVSIEDKNFLERAEKLQKLMEEVSTEAEAFYKGIEVNINGPQGLKAGRMFRIE